jgi:hypothetical protein
MTRNGDISTTVLNRQGRYFTLEDGTTIPIEAMLDDRGNAADPDAAIVGVYELQLDQLYRVVDLRLFRDELGNEPIPSTCPTLNCTAVNLRNRNRYFRLENGGRLDIKTTLGTDLRPTTDPDAAVIAIFQLPDGCYRGIDLRPMDDPDMQERLQ